MCAESYKTLKKYIIKICWQKNSIPKKKHYATFEIRIGLKKCKRIFDMDNIEIETSVISYHVWCKTLVFR